MQKLNPEQFRAVQCSERAILVLAGAGSGKTRVLTHRIAHLIQSGVADISQVFAVTFTNKAAAEMRHRVFQLLEGGTLPFYSERDLWISTFHSACVRILRSDITYLGYNPQFTIYDDSDQLSVIKAAVKELNVNDTMISPKSLQARINKAKNDGVDAHQYKPHFGGPIEDIFMRVFQHYAEVLKSSQALDFADLILKTVQLFSEHPRVLEAYHQRFPFVLVDEYQDTNRCQYLLMRLLAGDKGNVFAVGDEDQSIYRWRGADISNILNFEKDFPNACIFKLEENYRSTSNIIEAASHVISHNLERREKRLWTSNESGEKIHLIESYDEHDEALKVSNEVASCLQSGCSPKEIAVFYRTNAQSRLLEDMLRAKGIAYQIFGGLKFYERLEVKDSLAYLKLIANPQDDVSFRRIVNVPGRGIGAVSIERASQTARGQGLSLYALLHRAFSKDAFTSEVIDFGRSKKAFLQFFELMESFRAVKDSLLPSDLLNLILEQSGYRKSLVDERTVESQARLENLAELRQSIVEYELRTGADDPSKTPTLEGFLEEIALVSDSDRKENADEALKMMTIHMAKGLEFDVAFIVGLEEELFPNIRPWEAEDIADVEEERRLFYVGMTRARKKLFLLHAKNRTLFGNSSFRVMSRFVEEVPKAYLEVRAADYFSRRRHFLDRPGLTPSVPAPSLPRFSDEEYSQLSPFEEESTTQDGGEGPKRGSRVLHPIFGEGVVRDRLGADKLVVEFSGRGLKKISLKFGQLKQL